MKAVVLGTDADAMAAAEALVKGGLEVVVVGQNITPAVTLPLRAGGTVSTTLTDGTRLDLTADIARTADSIRRLSERDADRWPRFCERMHALAGVLADLYASPPPDPLTHETGGLIELARTAMRLRKLGRRDMTELLRLVPMSAADFLDAWFESDALKGVLGAVAVRHLAQGPRSGGTAFNFLHHHVGCAPGVFGQPHVELREPLRGVQRIEADAIRLEVHEGSIEGVVLDNGESIATDIVVSSLDPKHTLTEVVDVARLDPELVRSVRNIRSRGVAAYVVFRVTAPPDFSTLVVAPSLDYIERAYDDSKYGRVSAHPVIEATYDGDERVVAHVQYVPYAPREGAWDDERRKALVKTVAEKISEVSPAFGGRVSASALTPFDLEAYCGWPEGQAYHVEIALDQVLWMRPVPELARYRTPLRGLYLCGPAMHPGGVVPGAAGRNAASIVLADVRKR